ncbi:MAG: TetR family transcriptional regulator [Oleiphilus sp.]|nr:MAG: TetR family transcriptional regulator [Oleiphilus sp.]
MKTRERILHKSLELFNTLGEPNVTTLLISDELDISPGNLYYHFKSKIDILSELFDWYEHEMLALLDVPNEPMDIEDQWFFLHLIFESIARYRFVYQDVVNVMERHERLKHRFQKIITKKKAATLSILSSLQTQDSLRASDSEIEALCENIILTATFWISYAIVAGKHVDESVLSRGVYQVISLVVPYLEGEQRQQLQQLKQAYL